MVCHVHSVSTSRYRERKFFSGLFFPHSPSCNRGRGAKLGIYLLLCIAAVANLPSVRAQSDEDAVYSPAHQNQLRQEIKEDAKYFERSLGIVKKVSRLVRPSVVHINATSMANRNNGGVDEAGSGVIIRDRGHYYVLTNRHVIRAAYQPGYPETLQNIAIELADRRQLHPIEIWLHPGTDVAVMRIDAPNLSPVEVGDSDRLEIGDFVLAMGSPFALSHSVSLGIVSAKGRRELELAEDVEIQEFIQIDAAINPGNSGGPLINMRGELVAINTAIASNSGGSEGVGFSIPINMVMFIARQLINNGDVELAFLGVTMEEDFGPVQANRFGLPNPLGVLVTNIIDNSPAARADIHRNDVILKYNRRQVEDQDHLSNLIKLTPAGKKVSMVVWRNHKKVELQVVVGNASDLIRKNR